MFNAKSNNKSTYNKVHLLFYETKPTSTSK